MSRRSQGQAALGSSTRRRPGEAGAAGTARRFAIPHDHRLLFHGFLLFLLGLGTGLIAYCLENPRMGVSVRLEAIPNGVFLVGAGYQATPWRESLLRVSPVVGVLPRILCGLVAVWGLRARAHGAA